MPIASEGISWMKQCQRESGQDDHWTLQDHESSLVASNGTPKASLQLNNPIDRAN
jgi:hypothetical protein